MTASIFEIKTLLGIDDNMQDNLLNVIIDQTEQRIMSVINGVGDYYKEIPKGLDFVVVEVCIKRFNKMNSEGAKADSEEGRSYTWEDSYLDEYSDLIKQYKKQGDPSLYGAGTGIARFV